MGSSSLGFAIRWLAMTVLLSGQAVCQANWPTQNTAVNEDSRTLSLNKAAHKLQLIHQGEFEKVIPVRVQLLQTEFKHRLRGFISNVLNESGMADGKPQWIRRVILHGLESLKIFQGFKDYGPNYTYGHVLDVMVNRVPGHQDMLAVEVVIDANWDEDESLYIFQRRGIEWRNVLAAEVNGYSEVPDAQSSRFNYAVSPSAPDGSWFLVTSSVNPHKASAWQHVTYTALAPGPDADQPRILVRRTHSIYLGGSDDESHACKIKIAEKGFRVSLVLGFWNYSPAEERYTDEYSVTNGIASRVAVRCSTRNIIGRRVACSTYDRNYLEDVEKTYQVIKKHTPQ